MFMPVDPLTAILVFVAHVFASPPLFMVNVAVVVVLNSRITSIFSPGSSSL
jgi:hypothetical protein